MSGVALQCLYCGRPTPRPSGLCGPRCRGNMETERPADLAAALVARADRHEARALELDRDARAGGALRLREHAARWRHEAQLLLTRQEPTHER